MIKHVFLDLDDTILDFHKAEAVALEKTLRSFSIPVTEENTATYSRINKECWEALERGEITREALRLLRFERFFAVIGFICGSLSLPVKRGLFFLRIFTVCARDPSPGSGTQGGKCRVPTVAY